MTKGTDTLRFAYDAAGLPMTVTYNGTVYYYVTNIQGDVIAILNTSGAPMVQYTYDAWGIEPDRREAEAREGADCAAVDRSQGAPTTQAAVGSPQTEYPLTTTGTKAETLGQLNPLRYRSYVYDQETGLYYLQSRYYDPEMGRFINADAQLNTDAILGYNMFGYCYNNPIMLSDSLGTRPIVGMSVSTETKEEREASCACMNTRAKYRLTADEMVVVATIAAEASVAANGEPVSSAGRQAMTNVIMNRVGVGEWSKYGTAAEICQYTGFDGYGDANFYECLDYLYVRDGSNHVYESIIDDVLPVYRGNVRDITQGCTLYFTPAQMNGIPSDWDFSLLEEIYIMGVDSYYEGRFFRYK